MSEQLPPRPPEQRIEDLGLDPSNPNDTLIINGAHGDFTLALWMLAKEDLMGQARSGQFSDPDIGTENFQRLLDDVNNHILAREKQLGYGLES
jgi:hypothetical protein